VNSEPIFGRCLIMGVVDKLPFHEINRFLTTLHQSGFKGQVCLFAGPRMSRITLRAIRARGVEIIRYRREFPFIANPHPESGERLPDRIHLYNIRHFLYRDYLLKHGDGFRHVMITDVRDVVFQKDPFDFDIDGRIHVAMESTAIPISACDHTGNWLRAGYGDEVFEALKADELSCAGTTIAPVALMKTYLDAMLREIRSMRDAFDCVDQAAHNKLVHSGRLPCRKLYNFEGPILTVGTEVAYQQDRQGKLVNRDGSIINVIHQYDRHPQLVELFDRKAIPSPLKRRAAQGWFSAYTGFRRLMWRLKTTLLPA
jgi:hypothetical protein